MPIEFANVAQAKLLHFNPELGYFITPKLMLSVQGRLQLTTGASEVRYEGCRPNNVCQPASGAVAVVGKGTMLLEQRGSLQPYVSFSLGGGYIRYLVDLSPFALEGCGNERGTSCFDTVAGGGVLFGPSLGAWLHLTGPVFLTGAREHAGRLAGHRVERRSEPWPRLPDVRPGPAGRAQVFSGSHSGSGSPYRRAAWRPITNRASESRLR